MAVQRKGSDNPRQLTPRQEAFIVEYIKHGNATQAYRDAGYSFKDMTERTVWSRAYDVLHNSKVQDKINAIKLRTARNTEKQITLNKSYVLNALLETVETGLGRKRLRRSVVTSEGDSIEVEALQPDRTVAVRSAELLGKELGMFIDRKEIGGPGDFDSMRADELDAWLTETRASVALEHKPAEPPLELEPAKLQEQQD